MKENHHETILLEGLADGDAKIFDYLFHFYYSGLVAFAIKYVNDKDVAEDLVQEFFYKLWLNRKKRSIKETVKSYFFTAIKNRSLDFIRHQSVKEKVSEFILHTNHDYSDTEAEFLVESELEERINDAVKKLPEKCRHIFVLNRMQGMKAKEIAVEKVYKE